jgi:hypothetical protein
MPYTLNETVYFTYQGVEYQAYVAVTHIQKVISSDADGNRQEIRDEIDHVEIVSVMDLYRYEELEPSNEMRDIIYETINS